MKKIIAGLAVLAMGACVFAGSLSLTVDTVAQYGNGYNVLTRGSEAAALENTGVPEDGFVVGANDDGFILEMGGSYESSSGGAAFRLRNDASGSPTMDRWDVNIKPADWVKVGIGNYPIELFCESIKWEPICGAGMFENATPHIYSEFYPTGELTFGLGFIGAGKEFYKSAVAYAQYSIPMVGRMAFEFEMNDNAGLLCSYGHGMGEAMRLGYQFEYNGTDNLDLIAGVSPIFDLKDDSFKFYELRFDLFASFTADAFAVEAYNAFIYFADAGSVGDRFGLKASYAINDVLTPWFRANFLYNYGAIWNFGYNWGTAGYYEGMALITEAMLGFNLGNGVAGDIGAEFTYYDGHEFGWRVPLHIYIGF